MDELSGKSGIFVHHWDTDGMCSAALLLRELKERAEVETFTPTIGNFYLDQKDRKAIGEKNRDFVVVIDMALPEESIEFLKELGDVYIFDHHLQGKYDVCLHHNPVIDGKSADEYPSASWVMGEYLGKEPDMLSILGSVGDREKKLLDNEKVMKKVNKVLQRLNADFQTMLEVVSLLDSSYKLGARDEVRKMPWFLMDLEEPSEILKRSDLRDNVRKLDSAIQAEVHAHIDETEPGVLYLEMESPYNIISTVTRQIAWANEDKIVVVVNDSFMEGNIQVYIRGPIPDSQSIIEAARDKGYSAGGKSDVVGMVIPDEDRGFIKTAMEML